MRLGIFFFLSQDIENEYKLSKFKCFNNKAQHKQQYDNRTTNLNVWRKIYFSYLVHFRTFTPTINWKREKKKELNISRSLQYFYYYNLWLTANFFCLDAAIVACHCVAVGGPVAGPAIWVGRFHIRLCHESYDWIDAETSILPVAHRSVCVVCMHVVDTNPLPTSMSMTLILLLFDLIATINRKRIK